MERELNKLFNDTNYDKENVIIREIWSIKLEFPNYFLRSLCAVTIKISMTEYHNLKYPQVWWFILTLQSMRENEYGKSGHL